MFSQFFFNFFFIFPAKFVGVVDETQVAPPQGYTIRGEACKDECDFYGYDYTWCHKVSPSNLGNWRASDYCSNTPSKLMKLLILL